MSELTDLYQEVILDHNKSPRNFGAIANADRTADGHNPLCGDQLRLYVLLVGDTLEEVRFEGSGCAISKASASLMTEAVKGRTIDEATQLFDDFHRLLTHAPSQDAPATQNMGKLAVFQGVREFPVRVKCATLSWHTLRAALARHNGAATTE